MAGVRLVIAVLLLVQLTLAQDSCTTKARALSMVVDDGFRLWRPGHAVAVERNAHQQFDYVIPSNLVIVQAYNTGGPGSFRANVNGRKIERESARCAPLDHQFQNPQEKYPGVIYRDFDDSGWEFAGDLNNGIWESSQIEGIKNWEKLAFVCRITLEECAEPTPAPTPEPTPKPMTCPEQREQWADSGIPVDEPALTEDCKFEQKQCNDEKCFCVKAKTGARAFGPVEVPLGESYDCSRRPRKCQKKRFSSILNGDAYNPSCNKNGSYERKQCYQDECWCVKRWGKVIEKTRTTSSLSC